VRVVLVWTGEIFLILVFGNFDEKTHGLALACQFDHISSNLIELAGGLSHDDFGPATLAD
jgi:hypothetical protein